MAGAAVMCKDLGLCTAKQDPEGKKCLRIWRGETETFVLCGNAKGYCSYRKWDGGSSES